MRSLNGVILLVASPLAASWSGGSTAGVALQHPSTARRARIAMVAADDAPSKGLGSFAESTLDGFARVLVENTQDKELADRRVTLALKRMQRDMSMLDEAADTATSLSPVETVVLSSTVAIAFFSPYLLSAKVVELLVPAMSTLSAAVGFSAEYLGKVAVSQGKEIAATTLQAAAEAELLLAQAERAKAIVPLCVGISASAAAFALLVPALLGELATRGLGLVVSTEIYLLCPLIAVLAAAVAALAAQESTSLAGRAIGVGARRFSSSADVGRTWKSATEQIESSVDRSQQKWASFTLVCAASTSLEWRGACRCPRATTDPAPPRAKHYTFRSSIGVASLPPTAGRAAD